VNQGGGFALKTVKQGGVLCITLVNQGGVLCITLLCITQCKIFYIKHYGPKLSRLFPLLAHGSLLVRSPTYDG
jgi:hypothetical protein